MDLAAACEEAVREGHARVVSGSTIQFTGQINPEKLRQLEERYSINVAARFEESDRKEREAWEKWMEEGPWFF